MDYDGEMRVVIDDSDDSDDSDMAALFAKEKAEEKAKEKALSPQSYVTHHPPASDDLSSDDLSSDDLSSDDVYAARAFEAEQHRRLATFEYLADLQEITLAKSSIEAPTSNSSEE